MAPQDVVIQAKEFVINLLGHVDDIDAEARPYINLVDDAQDIIGLANSRRREDLDLLDIIILHEHLEFLQDRTDFSDSKLT